MQGPKWNASGEGGSVREVKTKGPKNDFAKNNIFDYTIRNKTLWRSVQYLDKGERGLSDTKLPDSTLTQKIPKQKKSKPRKFASSISNLRKSDKNDWNPKILLKIFKYCFEPKQAKDLQLVILILFRGNKDLQ